VVESSGLLNRRTGKTCTGGSNPPLSASIFFQQLVSGAINKKFRRQGMGKWEWDDAQAMAAALEVAGSWDQEVVPRPEPTPEHADHRFPIAQATQEFVDELEETAAFATHKKYRRLLMARLNKFSAVHDSAFRAMELCTISPRSPEVHAAAEDDRLVSQSGIQDAALLNLERREDRIRPMTPRRLQMPRTGRGRGDLVYISMQARIPKRKFWFRTGETCGEENIHRKEKSQMRKNTLLFGALTMLLAGTLCAQDITGNWQGTLKVPSEEIRFVIQIARAEGGGWKATMYEIDYSPDPKPVSSVTLEGSTLKFTIAGGKTTYVGKLSADGASIEGILTGPQHSPPLTLRRATEETAWPKLEQPAYQYHFKDVTIVSASAGEPKLQHFSPKLAVDYMEQGALAWTGERQCVSCHTNGAYMVVRPLLTPQLGQPQEELREFFVSTLHRQLATDTAALQSHVGPAQVVYVAAGLAAWDAYVLHRLSPETEQALGLMFKLQRDTGAWNSQDDWPPFESSAFQLATVAARAVGNAPGWLSQQHGTPLEVQVNRLTDYLRAERKLQGDYDRTALLWAASELPGLLDAKRKQELIEMICKHQSPDGGWSIRTFALPEEWGRGNRADKLRSEPEFADSPSDGHMTGLAIVALRKAGVPPSDPRIQRGISWLSSNQRVSGRWWTRSLNSDNRHFITYSGTLYPLLALALCDAFYLRFDGESIARAKFAFRHVKAFRHAGVIRARWVELRQARRQRFLLLFESAQLREDGHALGEYRFARKGTAHPAEDNRSLRPS
jgi:squalene-hopene/tetraprenyl-beta-curcumene cyclase